MVETTECAAVDKGCLFCEGNGRGNACEWLKPFQTDVGGFGSGASGGANRALEPMVIARIEEVVVWEKVVRPMTKKQRTKDEVRIAEEKNRYDGQRKRVIGKDLCGERRENEYGRSKLRSCETCGEIGRERSCREREWLW